VSSAKKIKNAGCFRLKLFITVCRSISTETGVAQRHLQTQKSYAECWPRTGAPLLSDATLCGPGETEPFANKNEQKTDNWRIEKLAFAAGPPDMHHFLYGAAAC
jgi:hypothetical protein